VAHLYVTKKIKCQLTADTDSLTDRFIRLNKLILSSCQQFLILACKAQDYPSKAAYGNPFNGANDRQAFKNLPEPP
jgi:hypothetical protein